jgi:acyl carrier protein
MIRAINTMQDTQKATIPPTARLTVPSTAELQREVAELMIECLNLEVTAEQIAADAPLYGDGLGLDSIDVLEVALVVSKRYGLQLRADSAENQHTFSSLRSLSDHIAAHRTR